jgi:polysaccharide export outer membrane protein
VRQANYSIGWGKTKGTRDGIVPTVLHGEANLTIWSWLRATARPTAIVLGLGIVAGCQAIPGDGPWMNDASSRTTEALPFDVIDLTPTTVVAYRPPATVDVPSVTSGLSAGGRVAVAPGDVLKVRIFEPYEGSVFPTIHTVPVAGLDLTRIEQRIANELTSKGKAQDPQVIVEFVADRTHTIMVSGDVKAPGRFSLLDGVRSVVDAINRAGGPSDKAAQLEVILRRNGQPILQAQYADLLAGHDVPVQKGDEIVVRPNSRIFTVLGAVAKAGNVELTKSNMTLLEALGAVSGLNDDRANKTGVFVFRMGDLQSNPNARGRVFRLDLNQPVSIFVAQQFGVQARDVLYVTNAPLYEYNKILTAIYRTFSIVGVAKGSITPTTTF